MKFIGFIKELDNFPWASSLIHELGEQDNPAELIDKVLAHMEKGRLITGWMSYFVDLQTNKPIAPHGYWSDGVWVWPSYYAYYLKKYPHYIIDQDFITYLSGPIDLTFDEREIEKAFIKHIT